MGINSCAVGRRRLVSTFVEKDLGQQRAILSCPGEGRDWAFHPTAQEFIPTLLRPTLLRPTLLRPTLLRPMLFSGSRSFSLRSTLTPTQRADLNISYLSLSLPKIIHVSTEVGSNPQIDLSTAVSPSCNLISCKRTAEGSIALS